MGKLPKTPYGTIRRVHAQRCGGLGWLQSELRTEWLTRRPVYLNRSGYARHNRVTVSVGSWAENSGQNDPAFQTGIVSGPRLGVSASSGLSTSLRPVTFASKSGTSLRK